MNPASGEVPSRTFHTFSITASESTCKITLKYVFSSKMKIHLHWKSSNETTDEARVSEIIIILRYQSACEVSFPTCHTFLTTASQRTCKMTVESILSSKMTTTITINFKWDNEWGESVRNNTYFEAPKCWWGTFPNISHFFDNSIAKYVQSYIKIYIFA